ncbi:hypothetical protein CKW46_07390 [Mycobacterium liflandii]|uniref:hypothetical protein n=1 Tax=Mycobacterium ulcerans TaxID=1809 RepID=UPI000A021C22|nr:hypothetical protein CKW46_07390 [Mycobacterium liflandii]
MRDADHKSYNKISVQSVCLHSSGHRRETSYSTQRPVAQTRSVPPRGPAASTASRLASTHPKGVILVVGVRRQEAGARGRSSTAATRMKLILFIDHRVRDGPSAPTFCRTR